MKVCLFLQLQTKHTELCQIRLLRACLAEFYDSLQTMLGDHILRFFGHGEMGGALLHFFALL